MFEKAKKDVSRLPGLWRHLKQRSKWSIASRRRLTTGIRPELEIEVCWNTFESIVLRIALVNDLDRPPAIYKQGQGLDNDE